MSENTQFVKNPLHLVSLFSNGIYQINDADDYDIYSAEGVGLNQKNSNEGSFDLVSQTEETIENMMQLGIINVFLDPIDDNFSGEFETTYQKLMSSVKVNQETVIPEDIEKIFRPDLQEFTAASIGDCMSPVIFVWGDREVTGLPDFFMARASARGLILRFPAFTRMTQSKDLKIKVWQTMQKVLKF